MKYLLGEEWDIQPAGGATGEAYLAIHKGQKLFIKRNSSPFLAVLSAEGIVPKLLWTRRLESGDVITAQEWIEGRKLHQFEMNKIMVPRLLSKIHGSNELLSMFLRLGNGPITPEKIVQQIEERIFSIHPNDPHVLQGLDWLKKNNDNITYSEYAVCHTDVHHHNWILEDEELFLIDWDGAVIGDPALDLAPLLYLYVEKAEWQKWLDEYGISWSDSLMNRIRWYMVIHCLENIIWFWKKQDLEEAKKWSELMINTIEDNIYTT